jgi:plastocyanin
MKFSSLSVLASAAALTALVGCGGGSAPASSAAAVSAPAASTPAAPAVKGGDITGVIKFDGAAPAATPIKMAGDAYCAGAGKGQMTEEFAVKDGKLGNVFVYLKEGVDLAKVPAADPAAGATIDQHGCWYSPHVLGLRVGQTLTIKNSDTTLHNIHGMGEGDLSFNDAMPAGMAPKTHTFSAPAMGVKIKCDVHSWMGAWANVMEHPYFATSGADGSFTIKNVPPGKYTLHAWHEKLGEQTAEVTVTEAGATSELTFKK